MIMPFIRLIAIYIIVILAIIGIFNRDKVMLLLGMTAHDTPTLVSNRKAQPAAPPLVHQSQGKQANKTSRNIEKTTLPGTSQEISASTIVAKPTINTPVVQARVADNPVVRQPVATQSTTVQPGRRQPPANKQIPSTSQGTSNPAVQQPVLTQSATVQSGGHQPMTIKQPLATPQANMTTTAIKHQRIAKTELIKRWHDARQAYWNGNIETAITRYRSLLRNFPSQFEFAGELGNIYYSRGQYKQAAALYHRAGQQLIDAGHLSEVQGLIAVLQAIAPDQAADLRSRATKRQ